MTELESNAQSYRTLYDDFLQRYTESVQAQSFPITDARIVTPAAQPLTKSHPKTAVVLLISAFGGVIFGLLIGHVRDLADRVFRTRDKSSGCWHWTALRPCPKIKVGKPKRSFSGKINVKEEKSSGKLLTGASVDQATYRGLPPAANIEANEEASIKADVEPKITASDEPNVNASGELKIKT